MAGHITCQSTRSPVLSAECEAAAAAHLYAHFTTYGNRVASRPLCVYICFANKLETEMECAAFVTQS